MMCNRLVADYPSARICATIRLHIRKGVRVMAEEQQIERELVVSADSDAVWDAITEAELASEWFDGEIEWELTPGGSVHVEGNDGESRDGVIQEVTPGKSLQF